MDKETISQLKNLRDLVRDGYNRIQGNALKPKEFLDEVQIIMQDFINEPKWQKILGEVPFKNVSDQYNSLTTHISFYIDASNNSDEKTIEVEFNQVKDFANRIILTLSSSIEIVETGKRIVRGEKIMETPKREDEHTGMTGNQGSSPSIGNYVSADNQNSVISLQRPLGVSGKKTKNLDSQLDYLLVSLGKLITQVDNWENLVKISKLEQLGSTSTAYVSLVENYQSSWSDLIMDLTSDYDTVWKKIQKDSDKLITNFEKIIECINDLKNPRWSIISIKKEVQKGVSTMIEIVRSETRQKGASN
jgi:hypothetical protein